MKPAWLIPAALLLAGCAGHGDWIKPGVEVGETAAAYRECRGLADAAVAPEIGIDQDILATRGSDWQRSRIGNVESDTMRDQTKDRAAAIIASCMQSKGFTRPR